MKKKSILILIIIAILLSIPTFVLANDIALGQENNSGIVSKFSIIAAGVEIGLVILIFVELVILLIIIIKRKDIRNANIKITIIIGLLIIELIIFMVFYSTNHGMGGVFDSTVQL